MEINPSKPSPEWKQALESLEKPLLYASRNEFANLKKLKGVGPYIHAWVEKASILSPGAFFNPLLQKMKTLLSDFDGKVPSEPSELQRLPGVGRKTANVVASVVYRKPVMAVDTHVFRVSSRLGLIRNAKTPLHAELQLSANIPEEMMHKAHHWLILHGRYVCKAKNPLCNQCGLQEMCKYFAQKKKH